jgi:hypothetical protein
MIIDNTNYEIGNRAMASVLLLYYHLLDEGGITNDQTVYLDPENFNGFNFLGVEVREQESESLGLDETLIKEGAIVYLLCDLNDMIAEFDEDYRKQPLTESICSALEAHKNSPIPEVDSLLRQVLVAESELNFSAYNDILQSIYKKYVHDFFVHKLASKP